MGDFLEALGVSNESLGLPLADQSLPLLDDSEDATLQLARMLTDTNAKYNILGIMSDAPLRPADITAINGLSDRTARRHFQSLISFGLLKKKGGRGGVFLAE